MSLSASESEFSGSSSDMAMLPKESESSEDFMSVGAARVDRVG